MPAKLDLKGEKFGRLLVVDEAESRYYGKQKIVMWNCICDCGKTVVVRSGALRNGNTKSCGCLNHEINSERLSMDISGMVYGRLTVLKKVGSGANGHSLWQCRCECGNETVVNISNLTSGATTSCGCYRKEIVADNKSIHGESHTRLYSVWLGMRERCSNPKHISYYLYGGRGISVCDEWLHSYANFKNWAEANGYDWYAKRGECTLDRINVNGDYCPQNCRWVNMKIQCANKRK
jgi:hypothetical protein